MAFDMIESRHYTTDFFEGHEQGAYQSANIVLPIVNDVLHPSSVIDVGCGVGNWLKIWKDVLGVKTIQGIEGPYLSPKLLQIPAEYVIFQDLKKPFEINKKFDLAMSLEVAEHLPESHADHFVKSLTQLGDIILFSASIEGQEGTYHINEQPPEYWASIFAKYDFVPIDYVRDKIWNNPQVEWWYQQNILIYVRKNRVSEFPQLQDALQRTSPTNLLRIHPWIYYYKNDYVKKTKTWSGYIHHKLYKLKTAFRKNFKK